MRSHALSFGRKKMRRSARVLIVLSLYVGIKAASTSTISIDNDTRAPLVFGC